MTDRTAVAEAELRHEIDYTRQRDWFDPQLNATAQVTLVGVGGIGSPTALALAKLGVPKLTLIDHDRVENHNVPNQLFALEDVGLLKVTSVQAACEAFSPTEVVAIQARIEANGWHANDDCEIAPPAMLRGVVVSGLDSMQARLDLWDTCLRNNLRVPLYLDARLGGENIVVYAVTPHDPDDIARYEQTLYTDEDAKPAPCTRQSVIDVGFAVASLLTRAVRRHYAGETVEPTVFLDQANLSIMKGAA